MGFTYDKHQMTDVATGAIILGAGGGGDTNISYKLLDDIMNISSSVPFVNLQEIDDNATVCVISGMGSPLATKANGFDNEQCVRAMDTLADYTGRTIDHVVAFETGGGNFMPPLYVACRKGITAIDADGVGRAVPETYMTMLEINGVPGAPFVIADQGDASAILNFTDNADAERIGRPIAAAFGGSAGVANYIMDGKTAKACLIGGTYERARKVGEAVRVAREKGEDPIDALCAATGGVELIRGKITQFEAEVVNAHDWGFQLIEGSGKDAGRSMKIHFENENIVAFDEKGEARVISPDLPCVLQTDGSPLTNADIGVGMEVSLVAIDCAPQWNTEKGLAVFKDILAHFGYDGPYKTIGELNA